MVDYLSMYPNSVHKDEIDDSVWGLIAKDDMQDLSTYLQYFPAGKHQSEARALRDAFAEWANARNSGDIFEVNRYVRDNPGSPFYKDAETTLLSLKQQEMRDMKENPNQYEPERLKNLLDRGVFTDRELIFSKVMTQNVLDTLKDPNSLSGLPDVKDAIAHSTAECKEGYTDVFFFGVPSTGKNLCAYGYVEVAVIKHQPCLGRRRLCGSSPAIYRRGHYGAANTGLFRNHIRGHHQLTGK